MLATPTIHLNGTSAKELFEGYLAAYRAIGAAIDAVQKACPNGRDYYPQGNEAIQQALAEHRARLEKLIEVRREIETIAQIIQDQQP